jgi:hypothetical protein
MLTITMTKDCVFNSYYLNSQALPNADAACPHHAYQFKHVCHLHPPSPANAMNCTQARNAHPNYYTNVNTVFFGTTGYSVDPHNPQMCDNTVRNCQIK